MSDEFPSYACRRDIFDLGLPVGTLSSVARLLGKVHTSTDTIEIDGHGFESGDPVVVRAVEGGTMPSPLVDGSTYTVIRVDSGRIQLAERRGFPAINLTTEGASVVIARDLPFEKVIEAYSRWIDNLMPAHAVPFEADKVPSVVRMVCSELTAAKLQAISGVSSEIVSKTEIEAMAKLERFAKGLPLRDSRATRPTNLAVVGSVTPPGGNSIP